MIKVFYKRRITLSLFFLFLVTVQMLTPTAVYALTSGPTQPESQSFQQAGTTDMVDLFSGDFSYNIPLFELPGPNGGYPFNLAYQSGVGMDQEATWVGLGWSLNPGAINRQMRGLPDEFKGDQIYTKMSIDPNYTFGVGAGLGFEFFGADGKKTGLSLSAGLSVYYNNYKGVGFSIDSSVGYGKAEGNEAIGGVNLGLSLDSKEGVSVNPSLSLNSKIGTFGLGVGYNSKTGLSNLSLSHDYQYGESQTVMNKDKKTTTTFDGGHNKISNSVSISLSHPGYTPQISMPMRSANIAGSFKIGFAWWGMMVSPYARGFYNESWLKNDKKRVAASAYGYMNYQDGSAPEAVLDFNREKDGIVSKESPNLAIPSLSYDIYSVTGQGISAMYRPFRTDYGTIHDPEVISKSTGGSAGVDIGPSASPHVGVNLSVNHSKSRSGTWTDNFNELEEKAAFQSSKINSTYEPWYFKVHGEPSTENSSVINRLGGDKAVRVALDGPNSNVRATKYLENSTQRGLEIPSDIASGERKPRTQVIQPITNEALLNGDQEVLSQFKIKYFDASGVEQTLNRTSHPKHHNAGFTALTPEGLRYNYGIPAYNLSQEEVTYTARRPNNPSMKAKVENKGDTGDPVYDHYGTEKFLKRVELPAFAHSYLLTSIIGPDYVDVTNDGVTEDDLGYWVKFTYRKTTTDADKYKWRDPFSMAHFQEGWKTDPRDDKGSFTYGTKEMWYLAKAETKSHISVFNISERHDGRGVKNKLQDVDNTGKAAYQLNDIKLYTRSAGDQHPIKTVRFEYDSSLCKNVYNTDTPGGGKLTLKKVWFEYGNSSRGSLNPYMFTYHNSNPDYDQNAYDRWGNYKPYPSDDPLHNHDFPYVEQNPDNKANLDSYAASWSIKEIQLPSGGKIMVDYETDDYAYVQHKQAMQMVELVEPYGESTKALTSGNYNLTNNTKIRFKLEKPIPVTSAVNQKAEVLKYLDQQRKQLYFKIKVNIGYAQQEDLFEYVCGYADINFNAGMGLEKDASGNYGYGYFSLVPDRDNSHPFSMRAWQHVRTNQPEFATRDMKFPKAQSTGARVDRIKSLIGIFASVKQMFTGFYKYCNNHNWGKEMIAGKSWIRLNSPDKVKYGGGLRVRQITMKDQWKQNEEGIYGQIYEYTTQENGMTISSGVAAYEPLQGGDEIPLRYAKKYTQSVPLRSDNNLYFEYPINESYYPGPQVGYSKVTVTSLAAASFAKKEVKNITLSDGKKLFPEGDGVSYGTSGMTVHEFYTAKDFPIITDETEKLNKAFKLAVLVPFVGSVTAAKLSASQGYSIVVNDMHGKQKKVSNYRQDKLGHLEPDPISWVKYNYASEKRYYEREQVSQLRNLFKENQDGTLTLLTSKDKTTDTRTLGQENEFFVDMREFKDVALEGGVNINCDFLLVLFGVIPVPVPWPSISASTSMLRASTTNKIIFKSGILESTEAYDGGSTVVTNNLKWDKLTGATVLTRVNNNFDAPIFSYSVPAYGQYQGMGAAYQNIGLTFTISQLKKDPYDGNVYAFTSGVADNRMAAGDEFLVYANDGDLVNPIGRVVYTGENDGQKILYSEVPLTATDYKCKIVRSGYRNQLSVQAGNITALEDPTKEGGATRTYTKTITIPE